MNKRMFWKTRPVRYDGRFGWLAALLLAVLSIHPASGQFTGPALSVPAPASQVATPANPAEIVGTPARDLVIVEGDALDIKLFGAPDYAPEARVSVDGTIQLPLIGVVPVAGLTVTQAEDLIAQRLVSAGMYKNPQVTVIVREAAGQFVTVSGMVHAVIPVTGQRRLFDILAAAGGLPPLSSHQITILRPGTEKPIIVNLGTDPAQSASADIPILPRDTIIVSQTGLVYILGAFLKQGSIPLDQSAPLTLLQATALSGGTGFEGRFEDMRIIRTEGDQRKMIKVDIKRIQNGRDPDPILAANDILYLPTNALKAAVKGGGINVLFSVVSLALVAIGR
jgi:polysaccharide export outer membrane protein